MPGTLIYGGYEGLKQNIQSQFGLPTEDAVLAGGFYSVPHQIYNFIDALESGVVVNPFQDITVLQRILEHVDRFGTDRCDQNRMWIFRPSWGSLRETITSFIRLIEWNILQLKKKWMGLDVATINPGQRTMSWEKDCYVGDGPEGDPLYKKTLVTLKPEHCVYDRVSITRNFYHDPKTEQNLAYLERATCSSYTFGHVGCDVVMVNFESNRGCSFDDIFTLHVDMDGESTDFAVGLASLACNPHRIYRMNGIDIPFMNIASFTVIAGQERIVVPIGITYSAGGTCLNIHYVERRQKNPKYAFPQVIFMRSEDTKVASHQLAHA